VLRGRIELPTTITNGRSIWPTALVCRTRPSLTEMEQRDQIHRRIDGKRKVIERPDYVLQLFRRTG
jgi:hypothetical protein